MLNTLSQSLPSVNAAGAVVGTAVGTSATFLVGEENVILLWGLLVFMAVDFVLGTLAAFVTKSWKSGVCRHGVQKKIISLLLVFLAHLLDIEFEPILGARVILPCITAMYCLGEFGSIIENLEVMGFKGVVPEPVSRLIAVLRRRIDKDIDKMAGEDEETK